MNDQLREKAEKAEEAECVARVSELKRLDAEEAASTLKAEIDSMRTNFCTFCQDLEQTVFPLLDEGHALIQEYGAENIADFKAWIEQRVQREVETRRLMAEDFMGHTARAEAEAKQKQPELEAENQRLRDKLKAQHEGAAKIQADLEAARQLLEVQVYNNSNMKKALRMASELLGGWISMLILESTGI